MSLQFLYQSVLYTYTLPKILLTSRTVINSDPGKSGKNATTLIPPAFVNSVNDL